MYAPLLLQCKYAPSITLSGNTPKMNVRCMNFPGLPITLKDLPPQQPNISLDPALTKAITDLIRRRFPGWVGYSATFSERNRGIVNLYIVKEDDDEFEDEMDAPIERVESNSSSEVSDTEAEDGFEMED